MHCEYAVEAARAGVHVLCDKPMAVMADECRRMIRTAQSNRIKLMVTYRLGSIRPRQGVRALRSGAMARPGRSAPIYIDTHRRRRRSAAAGADDLGGGSVYDLGVPCIHAARTLFDSEPAEVMAMTARESAAWRRCGRRRGGPDPVRRRAPRAFCTRASASRPHAAHLRPGQRLDPGHRRRTSTTWPPIEIHRPEVDHKMLNPSSPPISSRRAGVFLDLRPARSRSEAVREVQGLAGCSPSGRGRSIGRLVTAARSPCPVWHDRKREVLPLRRPPTMIDRRQAGSRLQPEHGGGARDPRQPETAGAPRTPPCRG